MNNDTFKAQSVTANKTLKKQRNNTKKNNKKNKETK